MKIVNFVADLTCRKLQQQFQPLTSSLLLQPRYHHHHQTLVCHLTPVLYFIISILYHVMKSVSWQIL